METELKFQVPAASRAAVGAAVATASARRVRLRARYFDTLDGRLAAQGLALRLRDEGGGWVQTLKGRGDGIMRRLEHEVPLAGRRGTPALDLARHDGSEAAEALRQALGQAARPGPEGSAGLVEVFATDVQRTSRRVRSGEATIEIAHDVGWLKSGRRRLAVHELEFELIAGAPLALPRLAARWVQRFGLWWDVRTKAERGQRLAKGVEAVPAVKATRAPLAAAEPPGLAFAAMVQACLAQALPNLAEIVDGRGTAEHLHQARVALRRLRSVLRECAPWSGDQAAARLLEDAWRVPFARLGAARDRDVMAEQVLPLLQGLGVPVDPDWLDGEDAARAPALPDPPAVIREPGFQRLLLRSLEASQLAAAGAAAGAGAAGAAGAEPLQRAAAAVLQRCWKHALADAAHFDRMPPPQQHRVRKRLKRLRYVFDFLGPLYPRRAAGRLQKALAAAGERLGELNDLAMAEAAFGARLPARGLQLLEARRQRMARRAGRQLQALRRQPRPWRG